MTRSTPTVVTPGFKTAELPRAQRPPEIELWRR